jgi:phenylpyruvate tautomerase PptA (4-oxalocrotonate tautomerase family)
VASFNAALDGDHCMPVISVTLLPGYPADAQHRLVQRLAHAARSVIDATDAGTTVFVHEASAYRRDGQVFSGGGPVLPDASLRVAQFLECMAARNLDEAQKFLGADFEMTFPGGHKMTQLSEVLAWAAPRYLQIAKSNMSFEESWQGDRTVVYCRGMLIGKWLDGTEFSNIRFTDRFECVKGLLQKQEVWNDLAEMRPKV